MAALNDWLKGISIHALREEGDLHSSAKVHLPNQFLSTPSARRATSKSTDSSAALSFLSTPSARRATLWPGARDRAGGISIHALREEGDLALPRRLVRVKWISIHALREEGDLAGAF